MAQNRILGKKSFETYLNTLAAKSGKARQLQNLKDQTLRQASALFDLQGNVLGCGELYLLYRFLGRFQRFAEEK